MRRSCWPGVVALLVASVPAFGDINIADTGENKLDVYGFIKLDLTAQDDEMNSLTAPRRATTPGANNGNAMGLTAMHSRFGLKWTGPEVKPGLAVSGQFEWDLFDASRNQMQLRTRLAYLELKSANHSVIAGQHWDIFGAGLPKTTLTNGFYWNTGNVGFRRAQVRYTRFLPSGELQFSLNDPTNNNELDSNMPLIEARYAWKPGKGVIGLAAAYGVEDINREDVPIFGVCVDGKWKFNDQFSLMGELYFGENLDQFLSRADTAVVGGDTEGVDVQGGFIELVWSVPSKPMDVFVGIAIENLTDDDQIAAGGAENTNAYFVGTTYSLGKGVSVGAEVTSFTTTYTGGADDDDALQLNAMVMYKF